MRWFCNDDDMDDHDDNDNGDCDDDGQETNHFY